jgi:membrane protease subunit HflK
MPWGDQSGGGGGPWGSGPNGGGTRPPDLEELLRKGQDKLKSVLPQGSGGRFLVPIVIIAVGALWLSQAVYQVQPQEIGVELLFGDAKGDLSEPGLHFHWWPVERVEIAPAQQENQENIGVFAATGTRRTGTDASLMLSGDQNIVDIDFSVLWRIKDPGAYLFNVTDQRGIVRSVAESAMREYVGRSLADAVRTENRAEVQEAVRNSVQATLDDYDSGIVITGLNLERAAPPPEVLDAFEEVQRAEQDRERFKQEAEAYANSRLGEARGEASRVREEAQGYKQRVVAEAEGEAQRFVLVYDAYAQAKDVTRQRLFLETLEQSLGRSNKVIIEGGTGSGVVPYLPLPEVNRRIQQGDQR